ncbi:urea transporter [Marinobacterium rhizophilum]|uniref:Urea transporter n=1 Tax=Marinobacterium rhizophilum TaxID=420402 RepID=A0ABY5HGH6_9GAMM|nr:urea transporter [Marinobacterium rhizophilum]UTW11069.1 urea transporter [Marinobacterium rhizophilum]
MSRKPDVSFWFDTLLHSFSQILFQSQRPCGALVLLALALESATALVAGLLGCGAALLGARLIQADRALVRAGYYGFNGALVGLALHLWLGLSWVSAGAILVFSAATAPLIQRQIQRWRIPPYTSAFVLLSWCAWLLAAAFDLQPGTTPLQAVEPGVTLLQGLEGLVRGLAQVFFLASLPAGLLILAALAVTAPRNAAWGLGGSLLGVLLAVLGNMLADPMLFSVSAIESGLFGYNGALAALALLQRFPRQPAIIAAGMLLATLLQPLFSLVGLPALTAPFVLACWLTLMLANRLQTRPRLAP